MRCTGQVGRSIRREMNVSENELKSMTTANDHYDFALFRKIAQLNLGIAQKDNHCAMELIGSRVPLVVSRFKSRSEHNGWVVPDQWTVGTALIRKNGKILFD